MSQLKVRLLTGHFRSSFFPWEKGASVGVDFELSKLSISFYTHKNLYNTRKERKIPKKHNRSPLTADVFFYEERAFNV